MAADEVTLTLGFWDISEWSLSIQARLVLSDAIKRDWQRKVLDRVLTAARKKVDEINRNRQQSYDSEMATYRNRLDEIRAIAVNDLLRSRSEAANRQLILRELKRQVLAMITREFSADTKADRLTKLDATDIRDVDFEYHQLAVNEKPSSAEPKTVTARFELRRGAGEFPVPKLDVARSKGRHVQFLEQAFEWPQLSYICYPYFWAVPPRWVDLMNRGDDVDPFFTDFLQAGYARVLLAVTPAYDHAVCHYLHCGEPWDGGDTPVIGDPLFIPLYQELREQTDDMANAVAEGEPWDFRLPTSLVYLEDSSTPLPPSACP
jgi:hypothetical protein